MTPPQGTDAERRGTDAVRACRRGCPAQVLSSQIRVIHDQSRGTYGVPRVLHKVAPEVGPIVDRERMPRHPTGATPRRRPRARSSFSSSTSSRPVRTSCSRVLPVGNPAPGSRLPRAGAWLGGQGRLGVRDSRGEGLGRPRYCFATRHVTLATWRCRGECGNRCFSPKVGKKSLGRRTFSFAPCPVLDATVFREAGGG
jgi:hypothetical protein